MDRCENSGSMAITSSEVTRRELLAITVLTGGVLIGGDLMPGLMPEAAAQSAAEPNSLGVKGVGEIATVGVAPAIANVIFHATGKRVRELPITPDKLL
jgi:hypothetical protein